MRALVIVALGLVACAPAPKVHDAPPSASASVMDAATSDEATDGDALRDGGDRSDASVASYPCLVRAPGDDALCPGRAHYRWREGCAPTRALIAELEQAGCERLGPDRAVNLKRWCCARAVAPPTR